MTVTPTAPHTNAVATAISSSGLLVGRGQMPDGAGWQGEPGTSRHVPYAVLWPQPGHTEQASLGEPHTYLDFTVQVTCVGATQDAAMTAMDIVRAALVGRRLTVDGRTSWYVQPMVERPAERDPTATPVLHYVVAIYRVRTEPA